jgi:signal transduction histidine kinase/CheY-like chemotaxis protein
MKLRSHLAMLVAGGVVPVLAVAVVAGILLVRHERATIERGAIGRTRAAMSAIDAELRGVVSSLGVLADLERLARGDLRALHAESQRILATQRYWINVRLLSAAKVPLFDTARPYGEAPVEVVDEEPLDRALRTGALAIGNVTTDPATGVPSVRIRLPVVQNGAVRYVLTLALDAGLFGAVLRAQQLPADWVIAAVDRHRRFVARIPPRPPGEPISESFRRAIEHAPEGFFRGQTVEGFRTYTPYVTSPLSGWVLGIAMPDGVVNAGATRLAVTMAAGVGLALIVALWLVWLVARRIVAPIAALAASAKAIGRGEQPAIPVDARVEEVHDVGRALEDAGAAVRAREHDLVRSGAQFESLATVARTINTLDLPAVLQHIVESACTILSAEVATVYRLDAASADMTLAAGGGPRGSTLERNLSLAAGHGLVGLAIERREAVVSDNVLSDPRVVYPPEMRARIAAARHRAGLAVPLVVQGRITGALFVGVLPGRVFSADEVTLVTMFADQAAAAMANAELYQDAQQANRAKDEFLAMLGHELRNPLGAIASAVGLLDVAGASPPTAAHARAVVARQVQHLSRLVDDLLDVSRVTAGKARLIRRPLDLAALVTTTMNMWRSSGRFDQHRVSLDVASAWVDADESRMEQVLSNLVGNALKYTPAGGEVIIRVRPDGTSAVLEVADAGVGMTPDLLERVFDLFVQGERTLERAQGGLGIGLTMVKTLVEMHGGTVGVRSEGLGHGSTFSVRLPRVVSREEPRVAVATPAPAPARLRILLVDDNEDVREMLRVQLTMQGHEVHEAADGAAGAELAASLNPDVALVDIGLPGLDGYEVARRIRAHADGRPIRLIALTGYGQAEDRLRALDAGFDAHVTKPVFPERLAEIIGGTSPRSSSMR